MMEKRFKATNVESLLTKTAEQVLGAEPIPRKFDFPKGTKFLFNGKVWFVIKAFVETGAEIRRIQSDFGDDETLGLHTLLKDAMSETFALVEPNDMEKLKIKAMAD